MDENDPPWNCNVKNTNPENRDFKKTNSLKFWDELTIHR